MNNSKPQAIRKITLSAVIALGFYAAVASAGTPHAQFVSDGANKYIVRFSDLDLSKMDGAAALYVRLHQAARTVCNSLQSRDLPMAAKYEACVQAAVTDAVASVNRPLLTQYHELRTNGDKTTFAKFAKAN
jgi:UrcA family protein